MPVALSNRAPAVAYRPVSQQESTSHTTATTAQNEWNEVYDVAFTRLRLWVKWGTWPWQLVNAAALIVACILNSSKAADFTWPLYSYQPSGRLIFSTTVNMLYTAPVIYGLGFVADFYFLLATMENTSGSYYVQHMKHFHNPHRWWEYAFVHGLLLLDVCVFMGFSTYPALALVVTLHCLSCYMNWVHERFCHVNGWSAWYISVAAQAVIWGTLGVVFFADLSFYATWIKVLVPTAFVLFALFPIIGAYHTYEPTKRSYARQLNVEKAYLLLAQVLRVTLVYQIVSASM